jgi:hypothetical protein
VGEYRLGWDWQALSLTHFHALDLIPRVTVTVKGLRCTLQRTDPHEWSAAEAAVADGYVRSRLTLADQLTALAEGRWWSPPPRAARLADAAIARTRIVTEDMHIRIVHHGGAALGVRYGRVLVTPEPRSVLTDAGAAASAPTAEAAAPVTARIIEMADLQVRVHYSVICIA